jgi:hypothetical protein
MLALIAFVAAQAAPSALPGVWEGNVGNLPIRACFVEREWGSFGAYYYLSQRRLIGLEPVEGARATFREGFDEGGSAPRWQVQSATASQLQARWTSGRRVLQVQLRRVAVTGDESPCGSMAFHQPRLEGVRTATSPATADGVAYTKIALDHGGRFEATVETFALIGSGEAVQRINAALARPLTGNPPEWFDCMRAPLETSAMEGDLAESYTPAMVSRRWLSVNHQSDASCGGAHPSSGLYYEIYDLSSGARVELLDWFSDSAVRRERVEGADEELRSVLPPLREAVLAGWTAEGECGEVVREAEYWNIGLRRDGFVFSPSLAHVVQACGEEFDVPFARVRQLLTPQGAAYVEALRSEPARSR